jgi:DNA-binding response OmpR family regulator
MSKRMSPTGPETREGGKEMKPVLIVEDEAIMRESLRDWLKDGGYEVETAEEGEDALQKIGEREFGVAVLDLRLPGKDGLEVLREATAQNPKLKGIIITAYPSVETAVQAMKMGAVDYIVKPFTPDALEKAIQEVLGPVQIELKPSAVTEVAVAEPEAEVAVAEPAVVEEVKEVEKVRNLILTKFHPLCRLCHYSGMSEFCAFFQTGRCAYHEALAESKRLQEQLCKLCQYSGFSDPCALFESGKCIYYDALEESKRLQEE